MIIDGALPDPPGPAAIVHLPIIDVVDECEHIRTSTQGSNRHWRRVVCRECGEVLLRYRPAIDSDSD